MIKKQAYLVVLGDLIASRKIKERKKFERKLKKTVEEVIAKFKNEWVAPLAFEKGIDEVGAVIKNKTALYHIINHVNNSIAPQKIRFVAYKGTIDIGMKTKDITAMDGEAFHTAAYMMTQLKASGMLLSCNTGNSLFDMAMENQVNAMHILKQKWTERQRQIFQLYTEVGNQGETAKKLKVSQQAISNALQQIDAFQIIELQNNIARWLKENENKDA